jgi:hypothetical protein
VCRRDARAGPRQAGRSPAPGCCAAGADASRCGRARSAHGPARSPLPKCGRQRSQTSGSACGRAAARRGRTRESYAALDLELEVRRVLRRHHGKVVGALSVDRRASAPSCNPSRALPRRCCVPQPRWVVGADGHHVLVRRDRPGGGLHGTSRAAVAVAAAAAAAAAASPHILGGPRPRPAETERRAARAVESDEHLKRWAHDVVAAHPTRELSRAMTTASERETHRKKTVRVGPALSLCSSPSLSTARGARMQSQSPETSPRRGPHRFPRLSSRIRTRKVLRDAHQSWSRTNRCARLTEEVIGARDKRFKLLWIGHGRHCGVTDALRPATKPHDGWVAASRPPRGHLG